MKKEVISLLKSWKKEVDSEINTGRLFLFGSFINYGNKQFNPNKSDIDLFIEFPKQTINSKSQTRLIQDSDKLKKIAKHIFWNINFSFIHSINSKIIHSLGSSKLSNNVKAVCDKVNTPASLLIKHGIFMRYDKSLQVENIYQEKEDLNFSVTAEKVLTHKIVNHCQTHSFGDSALQKIERKMKVSKKYLTKRK